MKVIQVYDISPRVLGISLEPLPAQKCRSRSSSNIGPTLQEFSTIKEKLD